MTDDYQKRQLAKKKRYERERDNQIKDVTLHQVVLEFSLQEYGPESLNSKTIREGATVCGGRAFLHYIILWD